MFPRGILPHCCLPHCCRRRQPVSPRLWSAGWPRRGRSTAWKEGGGVGFPDEESYDLEDIIAFEVQEALDSGRRAILLHQTGYSTHICEEFSRKHASPPHPLKNTSTPMPLASQGKAHASSILIRNIPCPTILSLNAHLTLANIKSENFKVH